MRKLNKNKIFAIIFIALAISLCFFTSYCFADETDDVQYSLTSLEGKTIQIEDLEKYINTQSLSNYDSDKTIRLIVTFKQNSLYEVYQNTTFSTYDDYLVSNEAKEEKIVLKDIQESFETSLINNNVEYKIVNSYVNLINAIALEIKVKDLILISTISQDIKSISLCTQYEVYSGESEVYLNQQEGIVNYSSSYDGKGMVVAVLDDGLDITHSAFQNIDNSSIALTKDILATKLESLNSYKISNATVSELYVSDKIAYAYDYGEKDLDVYFDYDSHGTHVSGIAVGNDDVVSSAARNAQLVFCKISDENGYLYDDYVISALEDCLILGVDVINMSFGSASGFPIDEDDTSSLYPAIKSLKDSGVSIVAASGNNGTTAYKSDSGENNASNVDNGTIGSPASYNTTLSVANAQYSLDYYALNNDNKIRLYSTYDISSNPVDFAKTFIDLSQFSLEYVCVPNVGALTDYNDIDVTGKIAVVLRGELSFTQKIKNAKDKGAIGVIIANNESTAINMVTEETSIPSASITKDDYNILLNSQTKSLVLSNAYKVEAFHSLSSQGVNTDLTLGVDIASFGTNIYSSVNNNSYEYMSGTSMASPNVSSIMTVLKNYVKENYSELGKQEIDKLATRLLMSSAYLAKDINGVYYSPRIQGAGIANLEKALNTHTYLYTSLDSEKVKIELKDDKEKNGVYNFEFTVVNTSSSSQTYTVDVTTLTEKLKNEAMSGLDIKLNPTITINGSSENNITVEAGQEKTISINIVLSNEDKEYLNQYESGIYVEGYVVLTSSQDEVSMPFIGFYGDWDKVKILDKTYYELENEKKEDSEATASIRPSTSYGIYGNYYLPLGVYAYAYPENFEGEVYADEDRAAISIFSSSLYALGYVQLGLLRNAELVKLSLMDNQTGEMIIEDSLEYLEKTTYYSSAGRLYGGDLILSISPHSLGLNNNSNYSLKIKVYFDKQNEDNFETYTQSFYVDEESPIVSDCKIQSVSGKKIASLTVSDNQYIQTIAICGGQTSSSSVMLTPYVFNPVTTQERGKSVTVKYDVTDYISKTNNGKLYFYVVDYAFNYAVYYIETSSSSSSSSTGSNTTTNKYTNTIFKQSMLDMSINNTKDLKTLLKGIDNRLDYTWTSSDEDIAIVNEDGVVAAFKQGTCAITVQDSENVKASIIIKVNNDESNSLNPSFTNFSIKEINVENGLNEDNSSVFSIGENIKLAKGEAISFSYDFEPWNYNRTDCTIQIDTVSTCDYLSINNGVVTAIGAGGNIKLKFTLKDKDGNELKTFESNFEISVADDVYIENNTLVYYFGLDEALDLSSGTFKVVGVDAFKYSKLVKSIVLPDTCTTLSKYAFKGMSHLESIGLGGVKYINEGAFYDCISLQSIDLTNVESLRNNAFYNCELLESVIVNKAHIGSINATAFINCQSLENFTIYPSLENKDVLVDDNGNLLVALSNSADFYGVTNIGNYAFLNREDIKQLDLSSSSLETIGEGAFMGCVNLEKVILPSTLKKISRYAFSNCTSLKSIVFEGSQDIEIQTSAFSGTNLSTVDLSLHEVYLGDRVFSNNDNLIYASLGNVQSIGEYTFEGAANITRVDFEEGSLCTGEYTFAPYVVNNAYVYHTALTYVTIPSTIKTIDDYCFAGCASLSLNSNSYENIEKIGEQAFYNVGNISALTFAGVKEIGYGAFAQSSIKNITLNSVEVIGELAFYYCENLTLVSLPTLGDINVNIKKGAFYNCSNLSSSSTGGALPPFGTGITSSINLDKVVEIGEWAFGYCEKLTLVSSTSVEIIGNMAFAGCSNLKSATFANVKSIGKQAFVDCELEIFNIPSTLEKVGEGAFAANNVSFSKDNTISPSIKLDNGVLYQVLDDKTYMLIYYPISLNDTKYKILDNTSIIGEAAFFNNTSIESVEIPSSIKVIGHAAFYKCNNLNTLIINSDNAPTLLGSYSKTNSNIYCNFIDYFDAYDEDYVSSVTAIVPKTAKGYLNNYIWSNYLKISFEGVEGEETSSNLSKLQELVNSLPDSSKISSSNSRELTQAKALYEALTQEEKALFEDSDLYQKYLDCMSSYENLTGNDINESGIEENDFPVWAVILLSAVGAILLLGLTVLMVTILLKYVINKKQN